MAKINILFICHGNICRSPMAEYYMKHIVEKAGLDWAFHIESAATSREEIGCGVYPPARRELQKHGISCQGHAAHQITDAELAYYDRIYYMDASNARYLRRLFGDSAAKCSPLLSRDVADPWYTGDFTATWNDIVAGCRRILEELS
jgi:protein-tyrosine phosphatase